MSFVVISQVSNNTLPYALSLYEIIVHSADQSATPALQTLTLDTMKMENL